MLKLRQADLALSDGRLEEAFDLLRDPAVRSHRDGQVLIRRLNTALAQRAKQHLMADRPAAATADCARAAALAGNDPVVAEIRSAAEAIIAAEHRRQHRRGAIAEQVRRQLQQGHLAGAQQALADVSHADSALALLGKQAQQQRLAMQQALELAEAAIEHDDVDTAVAAAVRARELGREDPTVLAAVRNIVNLLDRRLVEALHTGRPDLLETYLQHMQSLVPDRLQTRQFQQTTDQIRTAWRHALHGQYRSALALIHRLKVIHPDAGWIGSVLEQLRKADEALEALNSGPLGMIDSAMTDGTTKLRSDGGTGPADPHPSSPRIPAAQSLPCRFTLQVDGGGCFLVVTTPRVTIGPVSGTEPADVALLTDPSGPLVAIERTGEDYFLRSARPVMVNDRAVTTKLLSTGDRIAPSSRCRIGFAMPHRASTTAVVDLLAARLPKADVRRIVLLDRELIMGPGPTAHVRVDSMPQPLVLQFAGGRLTRSDGDREAVAMRRPIQAGGVSFMLLEG